MKNRFAVNSVQIASAGLCACLFAMPMLATAAPGSASSSTSGSVSAATQGHGDDRIDIGEFLDHQVSKLLKAYDIMRYDPGSDFKSVTLGGLGAGTNVRLTNVADGQLKADSTDAVNGRQLFALSKRVTDEISGVSERIAKIENQPGPVSPDGRKRDKDAKPAPLDGGGQRATNIAKGVADTDGVNVKQLNDVVANGVKNGVQQANAYTDLQVNSVRADMEHDRKDAQGGSASAIAIANLPQAYAGESMVSLAGGAFDGQSAVALGVSTSTQNWTVKASFTTNTRGSYGGGAGVGYRF